MLAPALLISVHYFLAGGRSWELSQLRAAAVAVWGLILILDSFLSVVPGYHFLFSFHTDL